MVALWGLIQSGSGEARDWQRDWGRIRRGSVDLLAGRRILESRDREFEGEIGGIRAHSVSACALRQKESRPRGNREAFSIDGVLAFMSDRAAARVAGCLAGRFRCKPCDHDRTADSHAATYR